MEATLPHLQHCGLNPKESRFQYVRSNAEALLLKAKGAGYVPALISFNNGMVAVGLCPCSNIVQAKEALKSVKDEPFCPKDVWILINE